MIQVDIPAAFTIGQIFALLSKKYLKQEPDKFTNKLLGPINLYLSCGFAPGGLFLLIGWPAWEVMYMTNWFQIPYNNPLVTGMYVLFVIVMILLGNLGFILAHQWYLKGKDKRVVIASIVGGFLTILPFMVKYGVWWRVGTYEEIQAGISYSFWEPPFFHGWLVIMGYLVTVSILMGLWLKNRDKRFN